METSRATSEPVPPSQLVTKRSLLSSLMEATATAASTIPDRPPSIKDTYPLSTKSSEHKALWEPTPISMMRRTLSSSSSCPTTSTLGRRRTCCCGARSGNESLTSIGRRGRSWWGSRSWRAWWRSWDRQPPMCYKHL
ncbi:hypothetical protein C4D60_Mb04t09900 [Musa balbisiana]|uniref:Uncharacterized protein n=1 Tax=Musa balbisiana TaxID=52838 RepID=A0A4S8KAW1_MUSBA|nr:hypothetical protein C4D60_Mb04t09900 [Musa balbisiana]